MTLCMRFFKNTDHKFYIAIIYLIPTSFFEKVFPFLFLFLFLNKGRISLLESQRVVGMADTDGKGLSLSWAFSILSQSRTQNQ